MNEEFLVGRWRSAGKGVVSEAIVHFRGISAQLEHAGSASIATGYYV